MDDEEYVSYDEEEDSVQNDPRLAGDGHQAQIQSNNPLYAMDDLVLSWNQALILLDNELVNEAYRLILSKDDDLYLIRLMTRTGVCFDKLEADVANELRQRALIIGRNDYIKNVIDGFLQRPTTPKQTNQQTDQSRLQPQPAPTSKTQNQYMRIEEYPSNPFAYLAGQSVNQSLNYSRTGEDLRSIGSLDKTLPLANMSPSQSFKQPVPSYSSNIYSRDHQFEQNLKLSEEIGYEESQRRAIMEKLKREAAEVVEMLKKQI